MTIQPCEPDLQSIQGGVLALTPPEHPYRVGVLGETPAAARDRFAAAMAAWEELHARRTTLG
jgi:hypothetical protein